MYINKFKNLTRKLIVCLQIKLIWKSIGIIQFVMIVI